jgi:hypothetical protein
LLAPGHIVDGNNRHALSLSPSHEFLNCRVVPNVLIAVGHHRTAPVPTLMTDNVHLGRQESVGRANDRTDVKVVLPVLNGNVKTVAAHI